MRTPTSRRTTRPSRADEGDRVDPSYSPAWNLLGYAYIPQGKYSDAETAFKKYIALVPNDPNPYDSYAEMLIQTGRFDESIEQYKKALAIDPHFSSSYIGIASNLMFQGKHDAAAAQAQKLYDSARDDGDRRTAMLSRAVIFVDRGDGAGAGGDGEAVRPRRPHRRYAAMSADAGQWETSSSATGGRTRPEAVPAVAHPDAKSGIPAEIKDFAALADHYNLARVALAKRDRPRRSPRREYISGAEATHDVGRIRFGHELNGTIALQERDFDKAMDHLAQADQQDPTFSTRWRRPIRARATRPRPRNSPRGRRTCIYCRRSVRPGADEGREDGVGPTAESP